MGTATYALMRESAVTTVLPRSVLRIEGKDTFDFLHRMSTNDLRTLADGQTRRTVIVSEKGRIIDLVMVVRIGEHAILLGSPGSGIDLARWFERFIIMDDVRITGTPDDLSISSIYGPESPVIIRKFLGADGVHDDRDDRILQTPDDHRYLIREDLGSVPGYLYIPGEEDALGGRVSMFPGPGAEIAPADAGTFETVRVEEAVPALGRELGPEVNPLEAGLKRYISFSKGCYIGQEVIARLDTYKKLQKILSLFIFQDFGGATLSPGKLFQAEHEAGRITSTVYSPRHGGWIGLGYRRIHLNDPTLDFIPDDTGRRIPCRCLSGLPQGYEEYEIQE